MGFNQKQVLLKDLVFLLSGINHIMRNKKVILFTIPTLDSLGAQRVLLTILKFIKFDENYQIKLLVISKTGNFKNEIPSHIEVISVEDYINLSAGQKQALKGYKVPIVFPHVEVKIDPYINCDAGTLRPTEHGEVWVTEDGGEIDQDLGNYERFLKAGPFVPAEMWKEAIIMFMSDLNEIINNAPPVKKTIEVWRGVKDFYFFSIFAELEGFVNDPTRYDTSVSQWIHFSVKISNF
jgi:hypothetical protein